MADPARLGLQELPDALLLRVVGFLEEQRDRASLLLVSRAFSRLVERAGFPRARVILAEEAQDVQQLGGDASIPLWQRVLWAQRAARLCTGRLEFSLAFNLFREVFARFAGLLREARLNEGLRELVLPHVWLDNDAGALMLRRALAGVLPRRTQDRPACRIVVEGLANPSAEWMEEGGAAELPPVVAEVYEFDLSDVDGRGPRALAAAAALPDGCMVRVCVGHEQSLVEEPQAEAEGLLRLLAAGRRVANLCVLNTCQEELSPSPGFVRAIAAVGAPTLQLNDLWLSDAAADDIADAVCEALAAGRLSALSLTGKCAEMLQPLLAALAEKLPSLAPGVPLLQLSIEFSDENPGPDDEEVNLVCTFVSTMLCRISSLKLESFLTERVVLTVSSASLRSLTLGNYNAGLCRLHLERARALSQVSATNVEAAEAAHLLRGLMLDCQFGKLPALRTVSLGIKEQGVRQTRDLAEMAQRLEEHLMLAPAHVANDEGNNNNNQAMMAPAWTVRAESVQGQPHIVARRVG